MPETAAQLFVRRNAHSRSDSAQLAAIATGPTLSDFRGLRLFTKETLPDITHETYGADSTGEYAYAATTIQSCSAGENAEIPPNTFEEAMTLPAKVPCKAASDKKMASLKKKNVCTLLPATFVLAGHEIIGSRWVYKVWVRSFLALTSLVHSTTASSFLGNILGETTWNLSRDS